MRQELSAQADIAGSLPHTFAGGSEPARRQHAESRWTAAPPRCTSHAGARAVGEGRHHVFGAANSFAGQVYARSPPIHQPGVRTASASFTVRCAHGLRHPPTSSILRHRSTSIDPSPAIHPPNPSRPLHPPQTKTPRSQTGPGALLIHPHDRRNRSDHGPSRIAFTYSGSVACQNRRKSGSSAKSTTLPCPIRLVTSQPPCSSRRTCAGAMTPAMRSSRAGK